MFKQKLISNVLLSATLLGGMTLSQPIFANTLVTDGIEIVSHEGQGASAIIYGQENRVQATNHTNGFEKDVTIDNFSTGSTEKEVTWTVTFDTSKWNLNHAKGGYYFIVPEGMKLKKIVDKKTNSDILSQFPKDVNEDKNGSNAQYRFFKKGVSTYWDRDFDSQWGWSVGRVGGDKVWQWKNAGSFSEIYYIDNPRHNDKVSYEFTAEVDVEKRTSFPLVAVMKNFDAKTSYLGEVASLAGVELTAETQSTTFSY